MFGGVTNTIKKSEAAVVVQQAIERTWVGMVDKAQIALIANRLIALVWEQNPELFEGRGGRRPHKVVIAAAALANGLANMAGKESELHTMLALGAVLMDLGANGTRYALTETDRGMLLIAESAYLAADARRKTNQDAMLNSLGL